MLKNICSYVCYILFNNFDAESHQKNSIDLDFKTAVKHIEKKDFFEAYEIFSSLADQGIPEAQFNLALLYSNGLEFQKITD